MIEGHLVSSRVEAVGDQMSSGHSAPYGKEPSLRVNNFVISSLTAFVSFLLCVAVNNLMICQNRRVSIFRSSFPCEYTFCQFVLHFQSMTCVVTSRALEKADRMGSSRGSAGLGESAAEERRTDHLIPQTSV